ncbi:MAG TPA: hypothetical protein VGF50_06615 [Caulobacteraceae bacterium]
MSREIEGKRRQRRATGVGIDEGVEFMHRVLWDHGIAPEYRQVHGADHLGRTLPRRLRDGLKFLDAHALRPPPPDESYEAGRQTVEGLPPASTTASHDRRCRRPASDLVDCSSWAWFPGLKSGPVDEHGARRRGRLSFDHALRDPVLRACDGRSAT